MAWQHLQCAMQLIQPAFSQLDALPTSICAWGVAPVRPFSYPVLFLAWCNEFRFKQCNLHIRKPSVIRLDPVLWISGWGGYLLLVGRLYAEASRHCEAAA